MVQGKIYSQTRYASITEAWTIGLSILMGQKTTAGAIPLAAARLLLNPIIEFS